MANLPLEPPIIAIGGAALKWTSNVDIGCEELQRERYSAVAALGCAFSLDLSSAARPNIQGFDFCSEKESKGWFSGLALGWR